MVVLEWHHFCICMFPSQSCVCKGGVQVTLGNGNPKRFGVTFWLLERGDGGKCVFQLFWDKSFPIIWGSLCRCWDGGACDFLGAVLEVPRRFGKVSWISGRRLLSKGQFELNGSSMLWTRRRHRCASVGWMRSNNGAAAGRRGVYHQSGGWNGDGWIHSLRPMEGWELKGRCVQAGQLGIFM